MRPTLAETFTFTPSTTAVRAGVVGDGGTVVVVVVVAGGNVVVVDVVEVVVVVGGNVVVVVDVVVVEVVVVVGGNVVVVVVEVVVVVGAVVVVVVDPGSMFTIVASTLGEPAGSEMTPCAPPLTMADATVAGAVNPLACKYSAAIPATCGDAIDVPLMYAYVLGLV